MNAPIPSEDPEDPCLTGFTHPQQSPAGQNLKGLYHIDVILGTNFKVRHVLLFTPSTDHLLGDLRERNDH